MFLAFPERAESASLHCRIRHSGTGCIGRSLIRSRLHRRPFKPNLLSPLQIENLPAESNTGFSFIELHVTDKETGKVLGARLISVVEEEAALMSLFADEWVSLTYKTLYKLKFLK